jgi:methyl-accepting chemotaxis protein
MTLATDTSAYRAITGAFPTATQTEQDRALQARQRRLKHLDTATSSLPRRWGLLGLGTVAVAVWLNPEALGWQLVAAFLTVGAAANAIVGSAVRNNWYQGWFVYGLALFDGVLAATPVVAFGPGGMLVFLVMALLPYAFHETRIVGDAFGLMGAVFYLVAAVAHGIWVAVPRIGPTELPPTVIMEAIFILIAMGVVRRIPARLIGRIKHTRSLMHQAESGVLSVRAPADRHDELGFLEQSFNHMIDEIASTVFVVQREADEVAVLAEVLSQAAQGVLASSDAVASTAADLAREMAKQLEQAETGQQDSIDAAGAAAGLRDRATAVASDARRLVESARLGRERVQRAGETLLAIGEDVRGTAATVQELSGMSERIENFALTISRIARQTHVLALNAAIEAAHSSGEQAGFSTVADEVRVLAGEASKSARDVGELIRDVQSRIEAVARAMGVGQEKVQDVGVVAAEAQKALDVLYGGVSQVTELVSATADVSMDQATRLAQLSQRMSAIADISGRSSGEADGAATAMAAQKSTIEDLNTVSHQLAQLAERMRRSVTRFTVLDTHQNTQEFSAVHPRATAELTGLRRSGGPAT